MKQLFSLFALLLLGAAQQPAINPVLSSLVGTWECTRPSTNGQSKLSIVPTSDGRIEFTAQSERFNIGLSHFYVGYSRDTGEWTFDSPTSSYVQTGVFHNGEILFASPKPLLGRFNLTIYPGRQTITWLSYEADQVARNYDNDTVKCTRAGGQ
jgi:hypothetical protein